MVPGGLPPFGYPMQGGLSLLCGSFGSFPLESPPVVAGGGDMQDLGLHAWMVHGVGHVFVRLIFLCTIAAVLFFSCSFFALSLGRCPLCTFLTCRHCFFLSVLLPLTGQWAWRRRSVADRIAGRLE